MNGLTYEEYSFLCCSINTSRLECIADIENKSPHLEDDEMKKIALQALGKIKGMTDMEFASIAFCLE